jgi:aspartyl-tRNA synthetase
MHRYRSHTCGMLREQHIGETVRLSGWVHRVRDHGGVLFIDLRDHYGLTQVVADPDSPAFKMAEQVRSEWVIRVDGKVRRRPGGTENADLPTGQIEIYANEIEALGPAAELPMPVFGDQEYPEDIRLKYRFLDLRRDGPHANIMKRGQIIDSIRRRMKEQGFFEFQTPILTASSPEGARDYLVPSRIHPGKFYALPQAPQQFKQLIMIAGFDRYFQIAPCFRDEDARADRSPGEFYQLDIEMSFVTQEDVFNAVEPVLRGVFEEFADGKRVTQKFPLIPYAEAMRDYGTDKPDLRNPIKMQNVSDAFRGSGFKIFASMLEKDPKVEVWAIPAKGGGNRAFCDRMNAWAQSEGQPGLGYIFWREGEEGGAGPLAKNIGPRTHQADRRSARPRSRRCGLLHRREARSVCQIRRSRAHQSRRRTEPRRQGPVCVLLDRRLPHVRMERGGEEDRLLPQSIFHAEHGTGRISRPRPVGQGQAARPESDPVRHRLQRDRAFLRRDPQSPCGCDEKGLRHRRLWRGRAGEKFGGMLRALTYGAPPHGGIAPGIDRIVMLLCGEENLREVVLFPMNQRAEDLMMGAPSDVTPKQLKELHIRLVLPDKN